MPSKKISQLNNVTTPAPTDILPIVQGTTTYKVTVEDAVNSLVSINTDLSVDPTKLTDRDTIKTYVDSIIPSQSGNNGKYLTTNGTIASWGNVQLPYKSYVAIISYSGSGISETILQNDFTGVTFTWSNPTTNVLRVTPSVGTTFTSNKTVVFVNSYANDYLVTPIRSGGPSAGVVNLTHTKWDGTTNSLSFDSFFIEIRVYP